jgi:hypothetical protein
MWDKAGRAAGGGASLRDAFAGLASECAALPGHGSPSRLSAAIVSGWCVVPCPHRNPVVSVKESGTFSLFKTSRIQEVDGYKSIAKSEWEAVRLIGGALCAPVRVHCARPTGGLLRCRGKKAGAV